MVLYGIWNYVYLYELSDHTNDHGQYSLWFAIAYMVTPVRTLLGCITDNVKRDESLKYTDMKYTFPQDYDRTNPMSSQKARARFLLGIKEKQANNASEKEKIDKELKELENKAMFDSLMAYSEQTKGLEIGSLANVETKPKSKKETHAGQKRLADKFMGRFTKTKTKNGDIEGGEANRDNVGLVRGLSNFWGNKNSPNKKVFPLGTNKTVSI